MKKLSVFALVAALVAPAFAEDVPAQSEAVSDKVATVESVVQLSAEERAQRRQALKDEIKAELKQEYIDAKKEIEQQAKDSDKSFLHGLQIGVGLSGTSGLNGIVGYANKDAVSFWGKRFGVHNHLFTRFIMACHLRYAAGVIHRCATATAHDA